MLTVEVGGHSVPPSVCLNTSEVRNEFLGFGQTDLRSSLTQFVRLYPAAASRRRFEYSHIIISSFNEFARCCDAGYPASYNNYLWFTRSCHSFQKQKLQFRILLDRL